MKTITDRFLIVFPNGLNVYTTTFNTLNAVLRDFGVSEYIRKEMIYQVAVKGKYEEYDFTITDSEYREK